VTSLTRNKNGENDTFRRYQQTYSFSTRGSKEKDKTIIPTNPFSDKIWIDQRALSISSPNLSSDPVSETISVPDVAREKQAAPLEVIYPDKDLESLKGGSTSEIECHECLRTERAPVSFITFQRRTQPQASPRTDKTPAQESPRIERSPPQASPRTDRTPPQASPRTERTPAHESPRIERTPPQASLRTDRTPPQASPRTERTSSQASPWIERTPAQASLRTNRTPAQASLRTEKTPAQASHRTENTPTQTSSSTDGHKQVSY